MIEETMLNEPVANQPMVKLKPALKDYLWGGNRLREKYAFQSDLAVLAEAWVLSACPDGPSTLSDGPFAGSSFAEYIQGLDTNEDFPLLIKFIDAQKDLSIQVHPDDSYARLHENSLGKNEMWYVIDSLPGSGLYVGFQRDVTREEIEAGVRDGSILQLLNFFPTHPGDLFYIPAGTVHAICAGNLICEIQQNSNCTYRLYDYNRKDANGNTRPLHLEKALDVLKKERYELPDKKSTAKKRITPYFTAEFLTVCGEKEYTVPSGAFLSVVCLEGAGRLELEAFSMDFAAGDSVFIPAKGQKERSLLISGNLQAALSTPMSRK